MKSTVRRAYTEIARMPNVPPMTPIVDTYGHYLPEYVAWAIERDNYPMSSLAVEDVGSDARIKEIDDIIYVETYPFPSRLLANRGAIDIKKLGGLAKVTSCIRSKEKMFIVWFNPNGSMKAREHVMWW